MIISNSLRDSERLPHMCIPRNYQKPSSDFTSNEEQVWAGSLRTGTTAGRSLDPTDAKRVTQPGLRN